MTSSALTTAAPSGAVSVSGADIARVARQYLGARWTHQGRAENAMDCAGLIVKVANELGLSKFDKTDYARIATDETMLDICREHLIEVDRADLQEGDIVVMRFGANRHIGIVGLYPYGGHTVIHAQTMHPRMVVENQLSDAWLSMVNASIAGCFRFPGLAA